MADDPAAPVRGATELLDWMTYAFNGGEPVPPQAPEIDHD